MIAYLGRNASGQPVGIVQSPGKEESITRAMQHQLGAHPYPLWHCYAAPVVADHQLVRLYALPGPGRVDTVVGYLP